MEEFVEEFGEILVTVLFGMVILYVFASLSVKAGRTQALASLHHHAAIGIRIPSHQMISGGRCR